MINAAAFQAPPRDVNGNFVRYGDGPNGITRALNSWQIDLALMVTAAFQQQEVLPIYCSAWMLSVSLTKFGSSRRCSKLRIVDHSAQPIFQLRIVGMMKCWRIALGLSSGRIMASAADLNLQ